jgi:hypothetical protein
MASTRNNSLIFLIVLASACHETETGDGARRAVVEAYLVADEQITVTVSREGIFQTGDTVEFVDGLAVSIHDNDNEYAFESAGDGKYQSDKSVVPVAGETYSLYFNYEGKEITSSTLIPDDPTGFTLSASELEIVVPTPGNGRPSRPDPVTASWSNPENDYHLIVVTCVEEDPVEISSTGGPRLVAGGTFRNEPNTGTTYAIGQASFKYYGMHAVILYKLTPEYATLYEDSGNSSLNLKSPYSNVTNGLGIFTGMNSDTLYLRVK